MVHKPLVWGGTLFIWRARYTCEEFEVHWNVLQGQVFVTHRRDYACGAWTDIYSIMCSIYIIHTSLISCMKNGVKACMLQLWNVHLLRAEFDHPEVILCGWNDIKVQLLTDLSVALQLTTKDEHHHPRLHHVEKRHWPHWPWPCLLIMDTGAPAPCYFSFLFCVGSRWTHVDRFLWYTSPGDTPGSALRLVASKIHLSRYCCCGLCCAGERHTHYTVVGWKNKLTNTDALFKKTKKWEENPACLMGGENSCRIYPELASKLSFFFLSVWNIAVLDHVRNGVIIHYLEEDPCRVGSSARTWRLRQHAFTLGHLIVLAQCAVGIRSS